jgi:hypothetical protein
MRDIHQVLGDQRAGQRGREQVLARNSFRRSRTMTRDAPATLARAMAAADGSPCPMFAMNATTLQPRSTSHFTQTDVSSPPEYASSASSLRSLE